MIYFILLTRCRTPWLVHKQRITQEKTRVTMWLMNDFHHRRRYHDHHDFSNRSVPRGDACDGGGEEPAFTFQRGPKWGRA